MVCGECLNGILVKCFEAIAKGVVAGHDSVDAPPSLQTPPINVSTNAPSSATANKIATRITKKAKGDIVLLFGGPPK